MPISLAEVKRKGTKQFVSQAPLPSGLGKRIPTAFSLGGESRGRDNLSPRRLARHLRVSRGKAVCAARAACEERAPKARCGTGGLGGTKGREPPRSKGHDGLAVPSSARETGMTLAVVRGGKHERPRSDGGDLFSEPPKYVRQGVHLVAAASPHATPSDPIPILPLPR